MMTQREEDDRVAGSVAARSGSTAARSGSATRPQKAAWPGSGAF